MKTAAKRNRKATNRLKPDSMITLRLPQAVHDAIADAAWEARESMNTFCARLVIVEGGILGRLPPDVVEGLRADGWLPAGDPEATRANAE
jgi:hypothetical protein